MIFAILLPLVLAIQILTMPRQTVGTDSSAIRLVSANLVQTGEMGIPFSRKDELDPSLIRLPGQFFVENEARQRLYSRWGEMNTLLYAIPELFRHGTELRADDEWMMWQNALNILFALLILIYFILIGKSLKASSFAMTMFVLCCFYGTFTWVYLRAHSYEIFQLCFFLGFFYHFVGYFRSRSVKHFAVAQIFLLALIHVKTVFIVLYAPSFLVIALESKKLPGKIRDTAYLGLSAAVAVASIWAIGYFKLGTFTLTGEPPLPKGWDSPWMVRAFPYRLQDYAIGPKSSFALYFPPLLLALGFWPRFYRAHRREAILLLSTFVIFAGMMLCYSTWGEWCIGPRYFLFLLLPMTFPLLTALSEIKQRKWRATLAAAVVVITVPFVFLYWNLNARPIFSRHWLIGFVAESRSDDQVELRKYLDTTNDFSIILGLNHFLAGAEHFNPVDAVLGGQSPERAAVGRANIRAKFSEVFSCNYYFEFLCP